MGENNIEWSGDIPVEFGIVSAYPNPFNSAIRIGFNLKSAQEVVLQALDIQGRVIADINQGYYQAGQHQVSWDAQSFQSGLYFIRLKASDQVFTQKVMLIR
ncbi:MAG: T9SS type A sorting domain-containing protein [Candidatus Hatepunaea meridiana]|nr:T9SS type A sorting domain-containing protein [Candidatus Hatepunaea meridiana]